jgi:tripeptidyl-peptidase I
VDGIQYIITQANLDIQYTESITYPTPNIFYSTGGTPPYNAEEQSPSDTNEPYLDWLHFILEQNTIPQTISTSYGDDEQTVPPDYAATVCSLFAQLGSRGVSLLFASGDGAVGGGSCQSNDGTNSVKFIPIFPASCAFYVFFITNSRDLLDGGCKAHTSRPLAVRLK